MTSEGASGSTVAPEVRVTGRRVLATIVDGIVLGVVFWLFSALFGTTSTEGG